VARPPQGARFPFTFWLGLDREARSELLHMMGLVAVVVAVVILVFFGLGYLFGRAFL
jgi:hypothetical protein